MFTKPPAGSSDERWALVTHEDGHAVSWLAEPREDLLRPAPVDNLIACPVRSKIADDDTAESLVNDPQRAFL